VKTQQDVSKVTSETNDDQNRTNMQLNISRIFYRTLDVRNREPTTKAQRALGKLEYFNPTT
jgi:hypothetical protein